MTAPHTLSELARFPQTSSEGRPLQVYRLAKRHGIDGPEHGYPTVLNNCYPQPHSEWHTDDGIRFVMLDDDGTGFCSRYDCWSPYFWNEQDLGERPPTYSECETLLDSELVDAATKSLKNTWVVIKASHWLNPGHNLLIAFLKATGVAERTILIVSAESLRTGLIKAVDRPGIKLAKTVSWERTLEDFQAALTPARLGLLLDCHNMIVRFGLEGVVHFQKSSTSTYESARAPDPHERVAGSTTLFFDPERIEGEYTTSDKHGELPGLTTVFAAAVIRSLVECIVSQHDNDRAAEGALCHAMRDGILHGVQSARRFYDLGYGPTPETVRKYERLQLPITQIFSRAPLAIGPTRGMHKMQTFAVDDAIKSEGWSILNRQLDATPEAMSARRGANSSTLQRRQDDAVRRARSALQLGREIVLRGAEHAFDKCTFTFPRARFGDLIAVDRQEVEGLRSIRNLLAEYISHPERRVPLSIAVFGPPGSGKSFGVRQIAKVVSGGRRIRESLFNLAQFEDFSEVSHILLQIRDAALDGDLPLVFFDEFDSPLKNQPLGWLKYFLAPMQDGRFQHGESMLGIGKAIFVFAGGIASRHDEFMDGQFWEGRTNSGESRENLFVAAKGPDFHSRLRGFLNIVGPNPKHVCRRARRNSAAIEGTSHEDPYIDEDFAYVVRRALAIRQMVERLAGQPLAALLDAEGRADIDRDVLDALLLSEEYKHGVRSLHAIMEMSALHNERSISKTVIPATEQVGMHVDDTFRFINRREYERLESIVLQRLYNRSNSSIDESPVAE